jgi:hypothetical protein
MKRKSNIVVEPGGAMSAHPAKTSTRRGPFDDERALADLVQRIYTLERRIRESSWGGKVSTYTPPVGDGEVLNLEVPPRQPIWLKIARFLTEKRIGPIDYIARQFDQYQWITKPLFPSQLLGAEAWKRYIDSKESKPDRLRISLMGQISRSKTAAVTYMHFRQKPGENNRPDAWIHALCDNTLWPLFVYCNAIGLAETEPTIRERAMSFVPEVEMTAAIEYVRFQNDYDVAWGKLIPSGFRSRAQQIYREVLAALY